MRMPVRVGAVNYLNTKPLIYQFEALAPEAELKLAVPSGLAESLSTGELDVALIPAIEYFRGDGYSIIPDISIASHGPVLSVTLFTRVPWAGIRSMALDAGSRTSAALAQIILQERHGVRPEVRSLPLGANPENVDADAVLLIGDRAMKACLPGFRYAFDLGEEWRRWTGLPFVFAVWAVRHGATIRGIDAALQECKTRGLENLGAIAQAEAPALGLDAGFCRRYLETLLCFDLGAAELAGLQRFYDFAVKLGFAPGGRVLRSYRRTTAAAGLM